MLEEEIFIPVIFVPSFAIQSLFCLNFKSTAVYCLLCRQMNLPENENADVEYFNMYCC